MSALSNEEFAKKVMEIATPEVANKPIAYYDRDGDCIEFLAKPKNFYAERIDDLVTVYYEEDSGEIIGSLVKGVSGFLKKHPNLAVVIKAGHVHLAHLFLARLLSREPPMNEITILTYQKLIECADETGAEAEMSLGGLATR
jgi:hypothetical protein